MAKRRMFSIDIVGSDAFLDMGVSARELYFQLGMYADDDGFIAPKRIMRMVGSTEDDLRVLLAKRFILDTADGIIVIKHWKSNNYIQKDRYQATRHMEKKNMLFFNENGDYTDRNPESPLLDTKSIQNVYNSDTQVRLGKVRKGKDNTNTTNVVLDKSGYGNSEINEMFDYWNEKLGYEITAKRQANRNACKNLIKKHGAEKLTKLIDGVAMAQTDQYAPRISDFTSLQSKLNDLMVWGKQKNSSLTSKGVKL